MKMHCWGCGEVTNFTDEGDGEGLQCDRCGHYQDNEASGAAEICIAATWHDLEEYKRVVAIAKAGGHDVPETPKYFQPIS